MDKFFKWPTCCTTLAEVYMFRLIYSIMSVFFVLNCYTLFLNTTFTIQPLQVSLVFLLFKLTLVNSAAQNLVVAR